MDKSCETVKQKKNDLPSLIVAIIALFFSIAAIILFFIFSKKMKQIQENKPIRQDKTTIARENQPPENTIVITKKTIDREFPLKVVDDVVEKISLKISEQTNQPITSNPPQPNRPLTNTQFQPSHPPMNHPPANQFSHPPMNHPPANQFSHPPMNHPPTNQFSHPPTNQFSHPPANRQPMNRPPTNRPFQPSHPPINNQSFPSSIFPARPPNKMGQSNHH
jgi:cytoskeletal protein RodZ